MWFEVQLPQKCLFICVTYRPPNSPAKYWDAIDCTLEAALDITPHVVLVGDLNQDLLNPHFHNLHDILTRKHMVNVINEPTRVTLTTSTLLDPIIISPECEYNYAFVQDFPSDISDHKGVVIALRNYINMKKSYKRKVWLYKLGDYTTLSRLLLDKKWNDIFTTCASVDDKCDVFITILKHLMNECIPSKLVTMRPNDKPWFDSDLRRELRLRDRLRKRSLRYNNVNDINKYKRQRNKVNGLKRRAKEQFYANLDGFMSTISPHNSSYWNILKYLMKGTGSTTPIPPLKIDANSADDIAFTDLEKADLLNQYFSSVAQIDDTGSTLPPLDNIHHQSLSHVVITEKEIVDLIMSLPTNKASGPDGINHRLLKSICNSIAQPLCILFNISLRDCKFPSQWKLAHVIPIYKKGDKSMPSNYRPISLLSVFGKLFERLILKYLHNYFHFNKLLNIYQSGFTPGHSTSLQLIEIYHNICSALDNQNVYCMVFCDISKAFDRVWHRGLLYKLRNYGIRGHLLSWIQDYLTNRKQKVLVNGGLSTERSLAAGVPQGSVLGPFLFLVYINDLSDSLSCITRLFADDTSIGVASTNMKVIEYKLNKDLENLHNWAITWLVKFNPDKTKFMVFSHTKQQQLPSLVFNNVILEQVPIHKHLGITFSGDAKWSVHVNTVIASASKMVSSLRKFKFLLSRTILSKIYVMYIRPILEYSSDVWDNCTYEISDKLEMVQLEAARIVSGLPMYASRSSLYFETGWEPLITRRRNRKLCTLYKIVNNQCPQYLTDILPPRNEQIISYNLRNKHNISIPVSKTTTLQKSFLHSSIRLWNELSLEIKNSNTMSAFKKSIYVTPNTCPSYFSYGSRLANVLHTKLRYACSSLKTDLNRVHLADTSICDCGMLYENSYHFFLECPRYTSLRTVLFHDISQADAVPNLETILNGNPTLCFNNNILIFKAVHKYIMSSKRF